MLPARLKFLLRNLKKALLANLFVYWREIPYSLPYEVSGSNPMIGHRPGKFAKIAILARQHYQEFVRVLPLSDAKELTSVLAQEYAEEPYVLHQFDRSESGQTRVCSFVLDPNIVNACSALIFFPETLLLANMDEHLLSSETLWDCSTQGNYYFHRRNGLSVSQRHSPLCRTVGMFLLNNGLPEDLGIVQPSAAQYQQALMSGLKNCLLQANSFGCWVWRRSESRPVNWRNFALLSGGVLASYLVAVNLYMVMSIEWRTASIEALGSDINVLLDSQTRQRQIADDSNLLIASRTPYKYTAQVWHLVKSMLDEQVSLISFTVTSNQVTFRGSASRATEVLAKLLQSPFVKAAEFSAPVRNENGREDFVILVTLSTTANERLNQENAESNGSTK